MLKIYNNIQNIGQVFDSISAGLLDYAPADKFQETSELDEADIIFMSGAISTQGTLSVNVSNSGVTLSNLSELSQLFKAIDSKRRVVYLDTMGPSIHRDENLFSDFRADDIVISPATVPERPNLWTHLFHIEKSVFHRYERFQRVPGSVLMSADNLLPEVALIESVMDVVSELHVTKAQQLGENESARLQKYLDKISCESLPYPKGIAYKASQCEFVLHTHTTLGTEMMGIEAGMCGCQPIYPDTAFYRDIFDGTGVLFYDVADAGALRALIESGATWTDKEVEAFRSKLSAEDNLPAFWDQVYDLYTTD